MTLAHLIPPRVFVGAGRFCLGLLGVAILMPVTACGDRESPATLVAAPVHLDLSADGRDSRSVKIDRETRVAIRAESGAALESVFTVSPDSQLEVAAGATCAAAHPCNGMVEFAIRGIRVADGRQLLSRVIHHRVASETWSRELVDLSTLAGERIRLELLASVVQTTTSRSQGESETARRPPTTEAGGFGTEVELWWAEPLVLRQVEEPPPNILLVSIDTLRADHLGSYGYERDTSPTLDALADEGVRFDQAISPAPWTTPSQMSLMTSMYPSTHGVNPSFSEFLDARQRKTQYPTMPPTVTPLATHLRDQGYVTLGVTGGVTIGSELGFARGFDRYFDDEHNPPSADLGPRLLSWLRTYGDSPFFLFFHTFEVHAPYSRLDFAQEVLSAEELAGLEEFWRQPHVDNLSEHHSYLRTRGLERVEVTSALYDGGILEADRMMATLLDELRRLGIDDRTIVVVTSDHGEELGDHDPSRVYNTHCSTLYDELVRVPLILRMPGGRKGAVVEELVEMLDVAPTLLDLIGLEVPAEMQGSSLRRFVEVDGTFRSDPPTRAGPAADPWSRSALRKPTPAALSESTCGGAEWKSLRTPEYKYIATFDPVAPTRSGIPGGMLSELFFHLPSDPGERRNLAPESPVPMAAFRESLLERFAELQALGSMMAGEGTELSPEMRRRLRALGYIR